MHQGIMGSGTSVKHWSGRMQTLQTLEEILTTSLLEDCQLAHTPPSSS